jgi:hypothetical protein
MYVHPYVCSARGHRASLGTSYGGIDLHTTVAYCCVKFAGEGLR